MPDRMLRKVWAHFDAAGPRVGVSWPIRYRWSDADRVAFLASAGVRAYPALAYAHRPDMAADLNAWTLDFAARTPGCVSSATFYPEPSVVGYVTAAIDAGARLFKVHLQVADFPPTDPLLDPVWGLLAEAGIPVVVHAGSGPVPNAHTGPSRFGELLTRHPSLVAVIAHMGAPEYSGFLELAARFPRIALDTTMAFTDFFESLAPYPAGLLGQVRDLGLEGRILLGSDFPNIPYPYAHQLDALARLDLGDDWLRAVCWSNAATLLGL